MLKSRPIRISYLNKSTSFEGVQEVARVTNVENCSVGDNTRLVKSMTLAWELASANKDWDSIASGIRSNNISDLNRVIAQEVVENHLTNLALLSLDWALVESFQPYLISIVVDTPIVPVATKTEYLAIVLQKLL